MNVFGFEAQEGMMFFVILLLVLATALSSGWALFGVTRRPDASW